MKRIALSVALAVAIVGGGLTAAWAGSIISHVSNAFAKGKTYKVTHSLGAATACGNATTRYKFKDVSSGAFVYGNSVTPLAIGDTFTVQVGTGTPNCPSFTTWYY